MLEELWFNEGSQGFAGLWNRGWGTSCSCLPETLGTELGEGGLKYDGCDLELTERWVARLSADVDKAPSWDSAWDMKMCGMKGPSEYSAGALADFHGESDRASWKVAMWPCLWWGHGLPNRVVFEVHKTFRGSEICVLPFQEYISRSPDQEYIPEAQLSQGIGWYMRACSITHSSRLAPCSSLWWEWKCLLG